MSKQQVEWPDLPKDIWTEELLKSSMQRFAREMVCRKLGLPKANEIRGVFSERLSLTDDQDRRLCVFLVRLIRTALQERMAELEFEVDKPLEPPKSGEAVRPKKRAIGFFFGG